MEEPSEITVFSVVKFLEYNGGRCTNPELVSHFKKLLNDPYRKADFRLQFKDIVNTIASVHEEHGVKYICLKKQYYSKYDGELPTEQIKGNENREHPPSYQPYWRYRLSYNSNLIPAPPLSTSVLARTTSNEEHTSIPMHQTALLQSGNRRKSLQDLEGRRSSCYEGYTPQARSRSKSLYQLPSTALRNNPSYVQRQSSINGREKSFANNVVLKDVPPGCQSLSENNFYDTPKYTNSTFGHDSSHSPCSTSVGSKSPSKRPSPVCLSDENIDSLLCITPVDDVFSDTKHSSVISYPSVIADQHSSHNSGTFAVPPFTENAYHQRDDIAREHNIPHCPPKVHNSGQDKFQTNPEWEKLNSHSRNMKTLQQEEICSHPTGIADPNVEIHLHSGRNAMNPQPLRSRSKSRTNSHLHSSNNSGTDSHLHSSSSSGTDSHLHSSSSSGTDSHLHSSSSSGTDSYLHSSSNSGTDSHLHSSSNSGTNSHFSSDKALNPELKGAHLNFTNPEPKEVHAHSSNIVSTNGQEILSDSATIPDLDEVRVHSGSVRERAQMIDTIAAASSSSPLPIDASPRKSSPRATKNHRIEKVIPEDNASIVSLDSKMRRQWFVKAAKTDYHGLVSLLKKEPRLAGIRDIASGFTALHWAAKQGNAEVVKLIAGTHKVSPNLKSNGGYTCIHLATLYKHKTIVDLLLKTYGANPTIRDNSGKRADQYPENYVSFTVGIVRKPPRPAAVTAASPSSLDHIEIPANGKRILVRPADDPPSTFIRIGSLNLKVSRTMGVFAGVRASSVRLKTWSSTDSVTETWSPETNEKILVPKKKKSKKNRIEISSPQSATTKQDSDSDSAYGF